MAAGLWVVVGIAGYLVLASLGLLLCRGIALADRAASTPRRPVGKGRPRSRAGRVPHAGVSVGSRRAVR